jgi:hypothetical protein
MDTIPLNDVSYYELLNELVRQEPAAALDPEIMGHCRYRHREAQAVRSRCPDAENPVRGVIDELLGGGQRLARLVAVPPWQLCNGPGSASRSHRPLLADHSSSLPDRNSFRCGGGSPE